MALLGSQGFGWGSSVEKSGELRFLGRLLGRIKQPVVFDVGGNVGDYTLACLSANSGSRIHIFEPSAQHLEAIRKRIPKNLETTVTINPFGLSDVSSSAILRKDETISGLASLNARDLTHIGKSLHIEESVQLEVGDEYLKIHAPATIVDLLKIDVEGWEMPVLKGFGEAIRDHKMRVVQFEFGHAHIERRENFRDFYRFFETNNYKLGVLKPNGKVWLMRGYVEIAEHYFATNYVAFADDSLISSVC